jgi:AcrR family transcriptional regulator
MDTTPLSRRAPGRPRDAQIERTILDATNRLLETRSVRDITVEAIAKAADVGKPTIYRRWPNATAVVLDAFLEDVVTRLPAPSGASASDALTEHIKIMVELLRGRAGELVAQLLGEGQSDADLLGMFRERFVAPRRGTFTEVIARGMASGELDPAADLQLALDVLVGTAYYRLLARHLPLSEQFARDLARVVIEVLSRPARA